MRRKMRVMAGVLMLAAGGAAAAGVRVEKIGENVVDPAALTIHGTYGDAINGLSFQQDALTSLNGFQYVTYYDGARRLCVARRRLPEGAWEVVRFEDYRFEGDDAHNVTSMGICAGDGTIHLSFDHHGGKLNYRVSQKGAATEPEKVKWGPELFGPVVSELEAGVEVPSVTYPRFIPTPSGGLQLCYRRGGSGNGDRMLADYDPATGKWSGTRPIDSRAGEYKDFLGESKSRCSYPNGYDYDAIGRLHATWVWREARSVPNHDLMYAWSDDGGKTWRNSAGETIGKSGADAGPKNVPWIGSPGLTVVKIGRECGLMNTHGQAVDSQGRIHVVMWHTSEETLAGHGEEARKMWGPVEARRYHHYWRDGNGEWRHRVLPGVAGNRPKLFIDAEDNAVLIFGGWQKAEAGAADIYFNAGVLTVMAATAASEWGDWKEVYRQEGPYLNEMLGDKARWKAEGVLSVMAQDNPTTVGGASALRVIDLEIGNK